MTINKVCGSGLKAVGLAAQGIQTGDSEIVVAGGMESMSNAPFLLPDARKGSRLGHGRTIDVMVQDGLWDVYNDVHMGTCCEYVSERWKLTRADLDAFSAESHRRAIAASKAGLFKKEILPVVIPAEKKTVDADEGPREDSTPDKLAKLKPAFAPQGIVTAGNASQISDGAAAVVLMSERALKESKAQPLARITGYATAGVDPKWVLVSTIDAVRKFDARNPWKAADADLVEINEAFAASTIAGIRDLKLDPAKVNPNGGGIALGHPLGATGTRLIVTALHEMERADAGAALVTMCCGGSLGTASILERL